jgi:hypothetical protein
MVQLTFGDTDLTFPTNATVGDIFWATNDIPYEFMSDLRWRNVVDYSVLTRKNPWVAEQTGGGQDVRLTIPISEVNPTTTILPLVRKLPLTALSEQIVGPQTANLGFIGFDTLGELYLHHAQQGDGNAYRGGTDLEAMPAGENLLASHIPNLTGETIWLAGRDFNAISNTQYVELVIDMAEHVSDLSLINKVKWKMTYDHGNAFGLSADNNSWLAAVYADGDLDTDFNHYYGTQYVALDSAAGSSEWGGTNGGAFPFTLRGMDDYRTFPTGSRYISVRLQHMTNNILRDIKIELFDAEDPGDETSRKASGLHIIADGNKIYTSDESTVGSIKEYDMTVFNLETASFLQEQNSFDGTIYTASEETDPLGIFVRSDGNNVYIADKKGKIKQYRMRVPRDILTLDDEEQSNQWFWNDYYKEFTTIASPLDIHMLEDGQKAFVLESDNMIREYDITSWDISTAVYSGFSLDCTSQTSAAAAFTITRDGNTLVIVYVNGLSQSRLNTSGTLDSAVWDAIPSVISVDNPKGIASNDANDKLYIADIPSDLTDNMRITQYIQSGL